MKSANTEVTVEQEVTVHERYGLCPPYVIRVVRVSAFGWDG
jgi:hypothetical protein